MPNPTRSGPRRALTAALLVATAVAAPAQVDRLELGLRLRAFERRLDATQDPARRDAAFAALDRAVQAFFRLDTATVAESIATADAALDAAPRSADERFAASLALALRQRLVPTGGAIAFDVRYAWRHELAPPADLALELQLGAAAPVRIAIDALPFAGTLPLGDLGEGDHELRWSVLAGDRALATRALGVSVVVRRDERLAALRAAADAAGDDLDGRSLALLAKLLPTMARGRGEETVLPGARLLADAEALAAAVAEGRPFHGPARPGQHWLRVPTGDGTTVVRLLVPPPADGEQALVLALHGAGGSENLFFDGYGDGAIVRACAARGHYLCAPRQGLGVPDLPALVDALAARYPIDRKRVFVIGHSMGAAMAVANAARAPERFAGVVALGGGGDPGDRALGDLPFFVAAGSRDFLGGAARQLHDRLQQRGATVAWRSYAGVEHLAIVQVALPDVFTWLDGLRAR
ncbi:MAG: alpha/beta fold hydrolase [Planctomycetes bacterium]|nr:alpha/beta fold hydrolase [Planctomycetota bacterium]